MTSARPISIRPKDLAPAIAAVLILISSPTLAQTPKLLGQDKDWGAYAVDVDGGKTCYVLSQPKAQTPKNVKRDPAYFFVTFRPKDKVNNQVSVIIGYPFKDGGKASVTIGSQSFTLFTKDDKAWIENLAEQDKLVSAMKAGAAMDVKGTSQRGTETNDRYSLSGVSAALGRVAKACP